MAGAFSSGFSSAFDRGTIDALVYDPAWISSPELFIPGRNPIVPIKIDRSHPLSVGLEYANIFSPGGIDLVNGLKPIVVDQTISIGNRGYQLELTGSSGDYFDTGYDKTWASGDDISVFCIFRTTDTAGTFISQRDGSTTAWQLYGVSSSINWNPGAEPFISILDFEGGTPYDGEWHSMGVSASLGTGVTGYADGYISVDGFNPETTAPNSASVPLSIGNRWQGFPGTGYELNGDILCCYIWRDKLLSDEDHRSLHFDPYQFLIPAIG